MAGTYLSFIDISYDVYLLDIFLHAFGIWLEYILAHVHADLM